MDRKVRIEPKVRDANHREIVDAINALGEQAHMQGVQLRSQCEKLEKGSEHFERIEAQLVTIRELTEVMATAHAVGRFALCFGRAIKWAGGIAAAIVAFFVLWREAAAALFREVAK